MDDELGEIGTLFLEFLASHCAPTVALARRGKWSVQEDAQLRKVVERMGAVRWSKIASFIDGRNAKQARPCARVPSGYT